MSNGNNAGANRKSEDQMNAPKHGMTQEQATAIVGLDLVNKALSESCEFTNRVIDDCYEITEMSTEVFGKDLNGNDVQLQVIFNVPNDSMEDDDGEPKEMEDYDYSDFSFFVTAID